MFRKLIAATPTWITLPIRLALGSIMFVHGAQKVFGLWGGPGIKAFVEYPGPYAFMRPSWLWMGAAAFGELVGGVLVFLGLLTRLGAFLIGFVMAVAILHYHWGMFFSPKGMEYPLALFAMALTLLIAGGGQASIDMGLMRSKRR